MIRFDFPDWLSPVILSLGPFQLTWYALAYVIGLIAGWRIIRRLVVVEGLNLKPTDVDDYLIYALLGVILGGRIGNFAFGWGEGSFLDQLSQMFWLVQQRADGSVVLAISGMSFHGGFLGLVLATILFWIRKGRRFSLWRFSDYLALVAPIGLFLGRIANFINRELYGRLAGDQAWFGVSFYPHSNPYAGRLEACQVSTGNTLQCSQAYDLTAYRHPSQLYEAAGEGLLLFILLLGLYRIRWVRQRPGFMTGVFIAGYGLARTLVEYVRSYDDGIGLNALGLSRSQELSLPMIFLGLGLMALAWMRARRDTSPA